MHIHTVLCMYISSCVVLPSSTIPLEAVGTNIDHLVGGKHFWAVRGGCAGNSKNFREDEESRREGSRKMELRVIGSSGE